MKYNNGLAFCTSTPGDGQLADQAWCDGDSLLPITPGNETILYSRLLADTPEEAMEEWGQYGYPAEYADQATNGTLMWQFTENPNDGDDINVWFDYDSDGVPNDAPGTVLSFVVQIRETCCEIVVKGPHELMPDVWYSQPANYTPVVANAPADGLPFQSKPLYEMPGGPAFRSQVYEIRLPNRFKGEKHRFLSDLYRPEAKKLRKFE
ncbi:MAG: hypothetical protein JNK04_04340, partial [Myxococcales bacterium]|nr:hypothetical protein [Myxococcales bacterium]